MKLGDGGSYVYGLQKRNTVLGYDICYRGMVVLETQNMLKVIRVVNTHT